MTYLYFNEKGHSTFSSYGADGTLYVFVRGELVYKRWPQGNSRVLYTGTQL